ncbi:MAG: mannose-1-phosphate guanylyltransferase [Planctomycetales bacterium]|nr:mannose-1-phosphate guanylyltransferase [Planctomycetales bacterium]
MLHAVVMAGGAGTRFWPASRQDRPKQLLDLAGEGTMIQSTVQRFDGWLSAEQIRIITNQRLVEPIRAQLPQLTSSAVLGEPCKRDTAPCIAFAAAWVMQHDPDAIMVVTPSDHVIQPVEQFRRAIETGARMVEANPERLVTFGIRPTYPAESFGYIQRGEKIANAGLPSYRVARFREKPKADVAQQYLEDGNFYWNSGIFVWKAATILSLLHQYEPAMFAHIEAIAKAFDSPDFAEVFQREFAAIVGKSIDYAVMERAADVAVIEAPFEWDDVGSWQALARLRGVDAQGNTIVARHLGIDTRGTIVRGEGKHLIVTLGLDDCLIVHTPDATLVASKHAEERIREVVQKLDGADDLREFL